MHCHIVADCCSADIFVCLYLYFDICICICIFHLYFCICIFLYLYSIHALHCCAGVCWCGQICMFVSRLQPELPGSHFRRGAPVGGQPPAEEDDQLHPQFWTLGPKFCFKSSEKGFKFLEEAPELIHWMSEEGCPQWVSTSRDGEVQLSVSPK